MNDYSLTHAKNMKNMVMNIMKSANKILSVFKNSRNEKMLRRGDSQDFRPASCLYAFAYEQASFKLPLQSSTLSAYQIHYLKVK
jgi:hypothetical protein